jgi:DNA-binding CsgD family transcriptional regulator
MHAPGGAPVLEQLIDQIYEAAIYPEKWAAALDGLARISQSVGGVIVLRRNDNWLGWRHSEGFRGCMEYMSSEASLRSTATPRLMGANRAGFVCASDVFSDEEYRADPMYTHWAAPHGLYHATATAIPTPSEDLVVVHFHREASLGSFRERELAVLDSLRPHLARAGLLAVRLQFERFNAIARGLELVGLPALVLDRSGRLLSANGLAQGMTDHIGWGAGGRIYLRDARADARLQAALPGPASCSFPSRAEGSAAVVHLMPVAGTARDLFEGGFALLLVTPIGARPVQDAALLRGLFDLTPAEADVCRHLAQGRDLEWIARARKSSVDTVRAQLKAIFAKTGAGRQTELIALLASVPVISS